MGCANAKGSLEATVHCFAVNPHEPPSKDRARSLPGEAKAEFVLTLVGKHHRNQYNSMTATPVKQVRGRWHNLPPDRTMTLDHISSLERLLEVVSQRPEWFEGVVSTRRTRMQTSNNSRSGEESSSDIECVVPCSHVSRSKVSL
mmetsp:Transcript_27015/g.62396  ORF Transcript_27015/g.62396 Transcript_27015/m.62396 type:complete len:144 (+) Transcript_27015:81-512(+)